MWMCDVPKRDLFHSTFFPSEGLLYWGVCLIPNQGYQKSVNIPLFSLSIIGSFAKQMFQKAENNLEELIQYQTWRQNGKWPK